MRRTPSLVVVVGTALAAVSPAVAQAPGAGPSETGQDERGAEPGDGEPGEGEGERELVRPRLVQFVEADYPEAAREQDREANVLLQLTIDREGRVTEAEVIEPAGDGFDEAALEAARRFRFEPATLDGEPIPSRIRYRYVFELDDAPAPPPGAEERVREGRLEGRVLGLEDGEPIAGAEVEIAHERSGVSRRALTGDDGAFRFDELPPGRWRVQVMANEYGELEVVEEVGAGESTMVTYRLRLFEEQETQELTYGAVAYTDPPPREVVRRTIEKEQLTRIPGTRGDALRTVELLPGVGRPPFGAGLIVVRGAAPEDSEVFFEGLPVPLLYHFGGLTSFMNSRLLERIEFVPGNFSARYGRKIGGILEVRGRDPAVDGLHGVAEVSLLDASILAEGPIGQNASLAVGLRRSYIDAVFKAFTPDDVDLVTAPVYWDYQTFVTWRPSDKDRVRFLVYGSSDRFELLLSDPPDEDPDIRGNVELRTQFHFAQALWKRQITDDLEQELMLAFGPTLLDFSLGEDIRFDANFYQGYGRAEWRARLSSAVRLIWGLDMFVAPVDLRFRGPAPRQGEGGGQGPPLASQERVGIDINSTAYRPAVYVESDLKPWDPLRFVLGLRLDYYDEIEEWSFDPRLVAIYSVTEDTRIKAGAGMYSQPPEFQESAPDIGNPDLEPIRSVHLGLGFDHTIRPGFEVGIEGFYKRLWDRVIETEGGLPPRFRNGGVGRIYGMELLGRVDPEESPLFGQLSYTLSRSERRDRQGERWRLFDYDQTHIFSLAAIYRLPKNWQLGATVRLVSGNPYTPVSEGVLDNNSGVYIPVNGPINSKRSPLFNRLDIRVEKMWDFEQWRLALFLDVQNVYNASNPEGRIYNFDYSESATIDGLPIIPALGLRGEM